MNIAFLLLLATPVATALSRNIALPMLLAATVLFGLALVKKRVISFSWTALKQSTRHVLGSTPVAPIAITTILVALASLLWSPVFDRGLGAAAQTTAAAVAASVSCLLLSRHLSVPSWLLWALPLSMIAACGLIFVELSFGSPLRSSMGASPELFRLNRAAVALALFLPILFIHVSSRSRLLVAFAISMLVVATVFRSESEAAKLAVFSIGAVTLLSLVLKARLVALIIGCAILISHILAPAIAIFLYTTVAPEDIASLPSILTTDTYHFIRLEIWWAYAQQILNAPFIGHGIQASYKALAAYTGSDPVMQRGLQFIHPHNASLQTWYELGVIGVLLTSALMILLLRLVLQMPENSIRAAAPLMAGVWSVAYVSHGAWQGWWWAVVGIVAVLLLSSDTAEERRAP